ncbi:hypothetical protein [Allomuricauda sp. SCSIO 65647]|uniref:hypothetical protein n=1 Tax=Allomuricauda sp. SCSIO 65647 TaxID=2908843 RepID=UPI001F2FE5F6|nr:hypothetical protein [Muricauda sp. SCSIO 65647]UJH66898.1 hypothetical protein L0P89_13150 [Muricauda sp. SCSIO 65647]
MRLLFIVLVFGLPKLTAQITEPKPATVTIESFGYPDFGKGYDFGDFSVRYSLTNDVEAIVKAMHQKTPLFEVFQVQLLMGKRLTEDLSVVGGLLTEWNFSPDQNSPYVLDLAGHPARHEALLGLEYKAAPNIMINANYSYLLNRPAFAPIGFKNTEAKGRFSLGSRFKL